MQRAVVYFLIGIFTLLILQPNLSFSGDDQALRIPTVTESQAATNDEAGLEMSDSHALIAIDASHGGSDAGYTSDSTWDEKIINLSLALVIGSKLQNAGYEVIYTRTDDNVENWETEEEAARARLEMVSQAGAQYLISIGLSNSQDPLTKGFSIFSQNNDTAIDLANGIEEQLSAINFSTFEGLDTDHYANFPILGNNAIPSLLLELGYITNSEDYAKLMDSSYQERIGEAVTQAFLNVID